MAMSADDDRGEVRMVNCITSVITTLTMPPLIA